MSFSQWRKSLLLAVIAYESTESLAFQHGANTNYCHPQISLSQQHPNGNGKQQRSLPRIMMTTAVSDDGITTAESDDGITTAEIDDGIATAESDDDITTAESDDDITTAESDDDDGMTTAESDDVIIIREKNGKPSPSGKCYYKRADGQWKSRKELKNVFIGERLFGTRLLESDHLDGKSGAKAFLDCGIGKINNKGKWSIVNGMARIAKKGMKASVVRKKLKKLPPNTLVEVYVSKIRLEEGTFEVCLTQNEALEKGAVERSRIPASSLKEGEELTGIVKNVTPYGVFVDVNANRNGLLHISKVARRQDKYVNKEDGLKKVGLGRGSSVDVIVVSNGKKRLELDLAPVREEIPEPEEDDEDDAIGSNYDGLSEDEAAAWAAYGADEGSSTEDDSAGGDDEAAMWAAYAAPDYSPSKEDEDDDDDDEDDEYDEDKDIEDAMGIGSYS